MSTLPLFERFPALEAKLPRIVLGQFPTPVQRLDAFGAALGASNLWIKRDDLTGPVFGGNKIRKLEFLLGAARKSGATSVLTLGFAGSNHAAATAICAAGIGLKPISLLLPQAHSAYVRRNLLLGLRHGARVRHCASVPAAVVATLVTLLRERLRSGKFPRLIPPGGSSAIGIAGYINAALELKAQVDAGELPAPDRIYVALGSMGTAVGLLLGLRLAGMSSRVVAVRVVEAQFAGRDKVRALHARTVAHLRKLDPEFPHIELDDGSIDFRDEHFGAGYGVFTGEARRASELMLCHEGIALDGTYSGKALAALAGDHARGNLTGTTALFWNTCNSRDLSAAVAGVDYHALPRRFHAYFKEDGQRWIDAPA